MKEAAIYPGPPRPLQLMSHASYVHNAVYINTLQNFDAANVWLSNGRRLIAAITPPPASFPEQAAGCIQAKPVGRGRGAPRPAPRPSHRPSSAESASPALVHGRCSQPARPVARSWRQRAVTQENLRLTGQVIGGSPSHHDCVPRGWPMFPISQRGLSLANVYARVG